MARMGQVPECEAGLFGRFAYGLSRRRFGEVAEPGALPDPDQPRLQDGIARVLGGCCCAVPETSTMITGGE
jgi:hypothetical protein